MRVKLVNPTGFVSISSYLWTEESPEHEIDLESLPSDQMKILSNCLRLRSLTTNEAYAITTITVPPVSTPIQQAKPNPTAQQILSQTVASIKKDTTKAPIAQLKFLKQEEFKGKKRKGLLEFFDELIEEHEKQTLALVGQKDIGEECDQPKVAGVGSDLVSDIIDSDLVTIEIPIEK